MGSGLRRELVSICGVCTVVLGRWYAPRAPTSHRRACLAPVFVERDMQMMVRRDQPYVHMMANDLWNWSVGGEGSTMFSNKVLEWFMCVQE